MADHPARQIQAETVTSVKRYAVYFTPPDNHRLTQAAEAWLGRSAFDRQAPQLPAEIATAEQRKLTASPRRYGFHATMKPPFRLAEGMDEQLLLGAFERFCAANCGAGALRLVIGRIGPFFALVPDAASAAIGRLADNAMEWFEPFRAKLTPAEIAKRNPDGLTPRQREHLMRWGYPYVLDEFRFHMTLTGPIEPDDRDRVHSLIEDHFSEELSTPLEMDSLGLFEEVKPGGEFNILAWGRMNESQTGKMTT